MFAGDDSVDCVDSFAHRRSRVQSTVRSRNTADLSDGIQNPTSLANRMFSADLLSRDTRRRISELPLTEQKVSTLLDVTETMIILNPQNFYKFVVELEKDSPMQHLCDKLRFTCGECE